MLKNVCLIIVLLIAWSLAATKLAYAEDLPAVTAKSAIVIEAATGKIIYARDAETQRYPASTTKMMTLIIALEQGRLSDIVTASKTAAETEGSSIWLEKGECLQLSDLLYAMMLVSGNDATVAVAEHIAGSVDQFAKLMTKKAWEIGATNTSFVNSSGLPDPRHYSTAHDLAKIAAYGYRNSLFAEIVSTKEKIIPWATNEYGRSLDNENRMLWLYDGGNGVKTGYTDAAGRCLVSAAKRDGVQLIAVVLDSEYMWNDSIALLNYGFSRITTLSMVKQNAVLKTVKVIAGEKGKLDLAVEDELVLPVVNGEQAKFHTVIEAPEQVYAAVQQGQPLGTVKIMYDDREIATTNLIATESIAQKSLFATLYRFAVQMVNFLYPAASVEP